MERPDDKQTETLKAEKREADRDEEQLITGEVVTSRKDGKKGKKKTEEILRAQISSQLIRATASMNVQDTCL